MVGIQDNHEAVCWTSRQLLQGRLYKTRVKAYICVCSLWGNVRAGQHGNYPTRNEVKHQDEPIQKRIRVWIAWNVTC